MFKSFLKGERLVFFAITLHLLLLLNLKFTAWPEMLAWPYLITKGWLPYKDIAIAHTPLLLANLTAFNWVFGIGVNQLKIFTWIIIMFLDITLFTVASRLFNKKIALFTIAFYIPLQLFYEGNGLWFDLYLTGLGLVVFYYLGTKKYLYA